MKHLISHQLIRFASLILIVLLSDMAVAQKITVSGNNWPAIPIPITEAGADYEGTVESPAGQITLSLTGPILLGNMRISAHYEPLPLWHNNLKLSVIRNDKGNGLCLLCSISGNENYIQLNTVDTRLFDFVTPAILTSVSNIRMQLKVSGLSVTLPAASYGCKVVFTIASN